MNDTNLYQPGSGLPKNVIFHVKTIYNDLVKPEELRKCLHGKRRNQNESFNSLIPDRASKYRYYAFDKLEFAVYDAVGNFNDGRQPCLNILNEVNVIPGFFTTHACISLNVKRIRSAKQHSLASWKKNRKIIRAQKKRKVDKNEKKEGKPYKTG